jgi:hypothetical protein
MDSGEKELRKIFEETTTNNVRAAVSHGNESRRLVRELTEKVVLLEGQLRQTNIRIDELKSLVTNLQIKAYQAGT